MNKDKFCVLIAESNKKVADLLGEEAARRGWAYEVVESAERLLLRLNETIYAEFSFDLIIADICFAPVGLTLDGLTALREIRKVFPNLPFVFFSSKMEALATTEALNLGATVCPNKTEILQNENRISAFFDRVAAVGHFAPTNAVSEKWNGNERRKNNIPALNRRRRAGDETPQTYQETFAAAAPQKIELPQPLIWLQRKLNERQRLSKLHS